MLPSVDNLDWDCEERRVRIGVPSDDEFRLLDAAVPADAAE